MDQTLIFLWEDDIVGISSRLKTVFLDSDDSSKIYQLPPLCCCLSTTEYTRGKVVSMGREEKVEEMIKDKFRWGHRLLGSGQVQPHFSKLPVLRSSTRAIGPAKDHCPRRGPSVQCINTTIRHLGKRWWITAGPTNAEHGRERSGLVTAQANGTALGMTDPFLTTTNSNGRSHR